MNERVLLLAGALLSVALVVGLLVPTPAPEGPPVARPTTADRGRLGLAGARAWLDDRGVPTASLRVRYDGLDRLGGPDDGNLLVLHLPRLRTARPNELERLRAWLRRGNTAVVLAAVAHRPRWTRGAEEAVASGLESLGLSLSPKSDDRRRLLTGDDEAEPVVLRSLSGHPLAAGVERLQAAGPAAGVAGETEAASPWLALFGRGPEQAGVWWRRFGAGALLVSAHPELFGNDPLRAEDNAQLLANLVARRVRGEGRVIFDDFHIGLSRLYDPEAFFSDPRLHATLVFLLGFWLLYVAGHNNRLGPPRRPPEAPSTRGFAEGVAGLLARRCSRTEVGRALLAHFHDAVRRRQGLPENGQPAWHCLQDRPEVPRAPLGRLRAMADRLERGRPVGLVPLIRTIDRIQGSLR